MKRTLMVGTVVATLLATTMGCGDYAPVVPATYQSEQSPVDPRSGESFDGFSEPLFEDFVGGFPDREVPASSSLLEVKNVTPVRLSTGGGEIALDPHEAAITLTVAQWDADDEQETHTPLVDGRITMPLTGSAVGFGFWRQIALRLVVAGDDYEVECVLFFDPDGNVQGAARVDAGPDLEFGELLCPGGPSDVGLLIGFRVAANPTTPHSDVEPDSACDGSPLPDSGQAAVGLVSCPAFDAMGSPTFEIRVWAEPLGPIGDQVAFSVQAQLTHPEAIVNAYNEYVGVAILETAFVELAQLDGSNPIAVSAHAPCYLDYHADPDASGTPGPVVVTTGAETAQWTATNGTITVEATEMMFRLRSPGVTLSTHPVPDPGCEWVEAPRLTFAVKPM